MTMTAEDLRCEYESSPLGLDVPPPRFSWVLASEARGTRQSAYHLLVSTSPEAVSAGKGNLWDTGRVESDQSTGVCYRGRPLRSGQRCFWRVRCWNEEGQAGPWSDAAVFEMGLLDEQDWTGTWIGGDRGISSPLLRKEFDLPDGLAGARLYISGLGGYEAFINGQRVGDHVLDPAATDYDQRILYVTHDVTSLLKPGVNAIGVMLGNTFYCQPSEPNLTDAIYAYGDSPRLLLQLNVELQDGGRLSLHSDQEWRVSDGPIRFNSIAGGEVHDGRMEKPGWTEAGYDDSGWQRAEVRPSPGGKLESQTMPAMKVIQTLQPVACRQVRPGVRVYDMGQCFGGWVRLRARGPHGARIIVQHSEYLAEDTGLVEKRPYPGTLETASYVLRGGGEEVCEPHFTFHPVRYVQIEAPADGVSIDDVQGCVVHSAVDLSGDFECSNAILSRIHRNAVWTLTNSLYGMPMDCLHREMAAYLDPGSIAGTIFARKFMPSFWTKWLRDVYLARKDGIVSDVAPDFRHLTPGDPWCSTYCILVWYVYQYYGDLRVLEEHFDAMKAWVEYLRSLSEDHLITKGHYGDHMVPGGEPGKEEFLSSETPSPMIWTGFFYRAASIVSQAATVLDRSEEYDIYAQLAEQIADAFNRKWLDPQTGCYATGSQTANLLPLSLGIVPKESHSTVVATVRKNIEENHQGHLHTGNIGTICLVEAMAEYGLGELMFRIAMTDSYPGWGYMVKEGATTIWESWGRFQPANPRWRTDSMMMFAVIEEFFYSHLAGIQGPGFFGPRTIAPGFQTIHIRPHVLGDLEWARASIKTVRGMISSCWRKDEEGLTLNVSIPANCRARVGVPLLGSQSVVISEGGNRVWADRRFQPGTAGVNKGTEEPDRITFDVGSGEYCFTAVYKTP